MGGLSKLSEQFTKNAIAPILIALSLTVGWIMLRAVQGLDLGKNVGTYFKQSLGLNIGNGVPVASLNTLQDFVVALGVIAVVWLGVFSAAEGTVADFATNWIKDKLQTAGKWVGSLPFKHMPVIPVQIPNHPHQTYTMSALNTFLDNTFSSHKEDNRMWEDFGGPKLPKAEDFRTIGGNKPALYSLLRRGADAGKLPDETWREELGKWKNNNETTHRAMLGIPAEAELAKAIDVLSNTKDYDSNSAEVQNAVKIIKRHKLIEDADTTDKTADSSSKPPAPAAPGTPAASGTAAKPAATPALTAATPFNGKTLGETLAKADGTPDTTKITSLTKARDNLALTIHNKGKDTEIIAQLKAVSRDSGGTVKTIDNLRSIGLSEDQITALKDALPDIIENGQVTKDSADRIGEALNPTPPATPPPAE